MINFFTHSNATLTNWKPADQEIGEVSQGRNLSLDLSDVVVTSEAMGATA